MLDRPHAGRARRCRFGHEPCEEPPNWRWIVNTRGRRSRCVPRYLAGTSRVGERRERTPSPYARDWGSPISSGPSLSSTIPTCCLRRSSSPGWLFRFDRSPDRTVPRRTSSRTESRKPGSCGRRFSYRRTCRCTPFSGVGTRSRRTSRRPCLDTCKYRRIPMPSSTTRPRGCSATAPCTRCKRFACRRTRY